MNLSNSQLSVLKRAARKVKATEDMSELLEDKKFLTNLLKTVARVNWEDSRDVFQVAADTAKKYIRKQKIMLTEEGRYIATNRPIEIKQISRNKHQFRVTAKVTLKKDNCPDVYRHISVAVDEETMSVHMVN